MQTRAAQGEKDRPSLCHWTYTVAEWECRGQLVTAAPGARLGITRKEPVRDLQLRKFSISELSLRCPYPPVHPAGYGIVS
jgi:hypothetical protein